MNEWFWRQFGGVSRTTGIRPDSERKKGPTADVTMAMRKAAVFTVGRQLNNGEMYIFSVYELDAAGLLVSLWGADPSPDVPNATLCARVGQSAHTRTQVHTRARIHTHTHVPSPPHPPLLLLLLLLRFGRTAKAHLRSSRHPRRNQS